MFLLVWGAGHVDCRSRQPGLRQAQFLPSILNPLSKTAWPRATAHCSSANQRLKKRLILRGDRWPSEGLSALAHRVAHRRFLLDGG